MPPGGLINGKLEVKLSSSVFEKVVTLAPGCSTAKPFRPAVQRALDFSQIDCIHFGLDTILA
jgi:hypothetical protein